MSNLTLLDVAALTGSDKVVGLIEQNRTYAPELDVFPVVQKPGTFYKTSTRTGFPTVGFSRTNVGVVPGKSSFVQKLVQCFLIRSIIQIDAAVDASDGNTLEKLEMIEASGVMKQTLISIGDQIIYGTGADANGFTGLKAFTPVSATIGTSAIIQDAGGTTAATASSVYFVKLGEQDVALIAGNGTSINMSPFRDQQIVDAAGTGTLEARVSGLTAWLGLQIANINCVGRIYNLTADSGKGLTDSLASSLLEQFPVGYEPTVALMSRRSRGQYARTRTVTLFSQAGVSPGAKMGTITPELPTEIMGVPIVVTDRILNTDVIGS